MRETQRLDKIISNFGYGTRKEVKKLAKDGLIRVDGTIIKDVSMHINPIENSIEVNGEVINYRDFVYIMMNKPSGVISATFDKKLRTVVDILPDKYRCFELFPVGRLDIDTEGLLIMTNDGQLAHEVLSPKKHVPKKYYALINAEIEDEDILRFKSGITLDDGYITMPAKLEVIKNGENAEIHVTIEEGKFHQVKRMFESIGKKVKYLRRIKMGGLDIDENLKLGEIRELSEDEVQLIKGDAR